MSAFLVKLVTGLMQLVPFLVRRYEVNKKKKEEDEIKANPTKAHADHFGASSGRVSINRDEPELPTKHPKAWVVWN